MANYIKQLSRGCCLCCNKPLVGDTRLMAKYNAVSDQSTTKILSSITNISKMWVNDVEQLDVVEDYIFDSIGEHIIYYELLNNTIIDDLTFDNCHKLQSIEIPNSVVSIGNYAFRYCIELDNITFLEGSKLTSIESYAFDHCYGLSSINIPDTVTSIGERAFSYCAFRDIKLPSALINIGEWAFYYSTFRNIEISDSVVSIGNGAFSTCKNIVNITIPNNITNIGNNAFLGCNSLISITCLLTTPPTLGRSAFDGNASGRKIYVPSESVDAYKIAAGWSTYASDIEPIN